MKHKITYKTQKGGSKVVQPAGVEKRNKPADAAAKKTKLEVKQNAGES